MSKAGTNPLVGRSWEHAPVSAITAAGPQAMAQERDTYWGRVGRLVGALPVSEKIES